MKSNILFLMLPALLFWSAPKATAATSAAAVRATETENVVATTVTNAKTISGILVNAELKKPMQGVSIVIEGTTRGAVSGADGRFKIEANKGETVCFTFVGYAMKKVTIEEATTDLGTIEMTIEPVKLEAVTVVAFAPKKEEDSSAKSAPQKADKDGDFVFIVVEKMPEFPGGGQGLMKTIADQIIYPTEAIRKNIQGSVLCKFVVREDGRVGNVKVIQSADPILDDEAIRVLYSLPAFTPGEQRGKKVPVEFTIPVDFRLN